MFVRSSRQSGRYAIMAVLVVVTSGSCWLLLLHTWLTLLAAAWYWRQAELHIGG